MAGESPEKPRRPGREVSVNDAPSLPRLDDAQADLLEGGHLWLQEWIDGRECRFRLQNSGVLDVGDGDRPFDPSDVPPAYRATVRHLRERLDRDALRAAVDDVEAVVFLGVATVRERVDYDWARIPPFLGYDVWLADEERFLPPDRVEAIYEGLGLAPVNAFRKEVRAVDFDPAAYEFPASGWYDGPAAGVLVRNKTGDRAVLPNPDVAETDETTAEDEATVTPTDLAREVTTDSRIDRVEATLETRGTAVTADALIDRLLETVFREEAHRIVDRSDEDLRAFRSEVASLVQRSFGDHG
jgi:hypothetical protein